MLVPSLVWGSLSAARTRERRWYVVIEPNPGTPADDYYLRSHSDIDLSSLPGTVIASKITAAQISSQRLNPDEGRASIGSMTVSGLDVGHSLTDRQRDDLLNNGLGLRGKRVSLYCGFRQIPSISDYLLMGTQVVDLVTYKLGGVWTLRCRDIQRAARKDIFEPIEMYLAQPLDATSTTIEMLNVPAAFQPVEHGTSYTDAPNLTVAYIRIDEEFIRVPAAGINPTQFTGVTRGVLGTRAAEHTTDENAGSGRGKKVTEVFYLEMPVPKLAYALLTGVLLNQSGTLPDSYHAGIDASSFVRTSDFQNIGPDLYDFADDTQGIIERYIVTESFDAKQFIERQLYRKYGLFSPVHANGELGLKRGQPVLSGSAVVGEINDRHIIGSSINVKYDMTKIINNVQVSWNEINDEPSRFVRIEDVDSVANWGRSPRYDVRAKGLVGNRHTDSVVRDLYDGLRDRYSGPPLIAPIPCHASQSLYEIGDVVRLRTDKIRDFTNDSTTSLDRAVEIQGVRLDLIKGRVTYDVFGSTQRGGPLAPLESAVALDDAFYTSSGTDISSLPGVVDSGPELVLPDGLVLAGQSTNDVSGSIYYATKDVRIPGGNTVTYTNNVQLRVRGTLQIDGDLTGAGQGLSGVADSVDTSTIPAFGGGEPIDFVTQAGTPAYFGSTQGNGGLIERFRRRSGSSTKYRVAIQSLPATIAQGQVEAVPSYNLSVPQNGLSIAGLPNDLRGTSGGPGALRYFNDSRDAITQINRGGTGGNGGAGLLYIGRGCVFGGSGRITSSGDDGADGLRNAGDLFPAWPGSGAGGAPGAMLFILDGTSSPSPILTAGTIIADYGDSASPGDPNNQVPDAWILNNDTRIGDPSISGAFVQANRSSLDTSAASGRQAGIAAARIFFLLPYVEPEEDVSDDSILESQTISISVTEAFDLRDDPRVTLLQATITEVSTTASYSHANIYTRILGDTAWQLQCSAEPNCSFELPADGNTYQVQARVVLINGVEQREGVVDTALVTDSNQVSATPSNIDALPLANGGTIKVDIPNTLGKPDTVAVYRSQTIDDASPAFVDRVPTFFVLASDSFCALFTDANLQAGQNYYYWVEAENETGTTPRYPSGNGELLVPLDNAGLPANLPGITTGGGATNIELGANQNSSGAANDGEIRIGPGVYRLADGTEYTVVSALQINTSFEGSQHPGNLESDDDFFYLMFSTQSAATRFGGGSWGNGSTSFSLIPIIFQRSTGEFRAVDNSSARFLFAPASTDRIFAVGYKTSASTGIESLSMSVAQVQDPAATDGATWGGNIDGQPSDNDLLNENTEWIDVSGTPNAPEDNATNNTGSLADQNTVGQFDIELFAAARTAIASTPGPVSLQTASWIEVETVDITLPASVADSSVQLDFRCSITGLGINTGNDQGNAPFPVRLLDDDNVEVYSSGFNLPYSRASIVSASGRRAASDPAFSIRVPAANLNAGQVNTFKLEIFGDTSTQWLSLSAADITLRATLLNQSE